jgi:phosphoribosylformylglycinamidine synthase
MPIAHGEGNYYVDAATHARLVANGQIALRYCDEAGRVTRDANPNGAFDNIAGVVNERGNVLGLMPHPERCSESLLGGTDGLLVLRALDTRLARPVLLSVSEN